jgi:broad specificity phosphatase PhoE
MKIVLVRHGESEGNVAHLINEQNVFDFEQRVPGYGRIPHAPIAGTRR